VLGVEDLVDRDAVGAQDRAPLERSGADRVRVAEQLVAVEVDGAAAQFNVPGPREPGTDQRPHGEQPLQDQRPVVRQLAVERVELAALGGRPGEPGWRSSSADHRARVAVQVGDSAANLQARKAGLVEHARDGGAFGGLDLAGLDLLVQVTVAGASSRAAGSG
jgi:hypothetical protein